MSDTYEKLGLRPIPLCREGALASGCNCPWHETQHGPTMAGKVPVWAGWQRADGDWDLGFDYNLGLAVQPWYIVVDIDPRNGGTATVEQWEREHGPFPPTWEVITPTGGRHLYYRIDRPFASTKIGGVDLLSVGRQAVAPPSERNGGAYRWREEPSAETLAWAPAWLRDVFPAKIKAAPIENVEAYIEHAVPAALNRLAKAPRGERNETLNQVAFGLGQLIALGKLDPDAVFAEVRSQALQTGLDEEEVDATIARAYASGIVTPRAIAEPPSIPARLGCPMPDFLAMDHPPLQMLVEPYISEGSITVVYGAPASLKTWFALDVVKRAADAGRRVMLVEEEGRPTKLAQRFKRMGITHGNVWTVIRQGVRLDEPAWLEKLEEAITKGRFELVVLDPFADLHQLDENEQKQMRQLVERIKGLSVRTGAALLLVHHTTKAGWTSGANWEQVGLHNLRGAGSLGAALDMAIQLVREKDLDVKASLVHVTKDKDNVVPNPHPGRMELTETASGGISIEWMDGDAVKEHKAETKQKKEDEKQDKQDAEDQKCLNIVRSEPGIGIKDLAGLLKRSTTYTYAVLARLKDKGLVERRGKRWEAV